jgi:hypothetical protein
VRLPFAAGLALSAGFALAAGAAFAQIRTAPALRSARQDLRECIVRNAGWASAKAEATPDNVADAAARACEDRYIKAVVRRRLMDKAQAKVETNMMAYDIAYKILGR